MKKKTHWFWIIYFFIYCIPTLVRSLTLFAEDSIINQYFRVLIAFKKTYFIWHTFSIANTIVETLALIPLCLFCFKRRFLNPSMWKMLFVARIFLLFAGHHYEWKMTQSFFHADSTYLVAVITSLVLFSAPSYIACYVYAFHQDRLSLQ